MNKRLDYTIRELKALSSEELDTLQDGLIEHIGTENEQDARSLNRAINDERRFREGEVYYGWD